MSSSPWAEHLRVAVLITTSSSNFLISWRDKINIFHIPFLLNHIAKIFFCYGGLLHYQIALRNTSYIHWAIRVVRKTRHGDVTGRFCRSQAAAKCRVQKRSGKTPIYNHLFVEPWRYYWGAFLPYLCKQLCVSFDHSLVLREKLEDDNLIISKLFNKTIESISPRKSNGIIDDSLNIFQ